ncbi:Hydantoinase/oxoprolinase-domain-containing protein [Mycena rosella]|uniref:Hydantoinase/oxoprolinase-domain-containing protein n=1 Tax=Mycena rosella TaxID=1033263 RepID=A0AAD7CT45_MYCRO|nr:Hydantoinase/oxoprolinase-domain-containing protein [Mycena rosella]
MACDDPPQGQEDGGEEAGDKGGPRINGRVEDVEYPDYILLSTTVATNALLELKGHKHALLITRVDLNIRRPHPLYSTVVEVTLVGYTSDPKAEEHAVQFDAQGKVERGYRGKGWDAEGHAEGPGEVVQGLSGEAVRIMRAPTALYGEGFRSLAIVFAHSDTFPAHERLVGELARAVGFTHVSESAQLLPMIKCGFGEKLKDGRLRSPRVGSDGGLLDLDNFSGLKSILSGSAGGVVGCAARLFLPLDLTELQTRYRRDFYVGSWHLARTTVYETTTAGVTIQSPQLALNTVAAGGGSCLTFRNGLFLAGPHSAGGNFTSTFLRIRLPRAHSRARASLLSVISPHLPTHSLTPSAQERRAVGVTDANLLLGRYSASRRRSRWTWTPRGPRSSRQLVAEINESYEKKLSFDEIVYGFIKVANETMCRPIRAFTEARGHATFQHVLASFGGAGGQHACKIASLLGIKTILIHRYSSILSAYGLVLADRAYELQEPSSAFYSASTRQTLTVRLDKLTADVRRELERQGFEAGRVHVERMLNMRFEGTDTALMVLPNAGDGDGAEDFEAAFKRVYKSEFGFLLETRASSSTISRSAGSARRSIAWASRCTRRWRGSRGARRRAGQGGPLARVQRVLRPRRPGGRHAGVPARQVGGRGRGRGPGGDHRRHADHRARAWGGVGAPSKHLCITLE